MKLKINLSLMRTVMLFFMACMVVPGWATVTATYNNTTKTITFTGSGEITQDIVKGVSGYANATNIYIGGGVTTIGSKAFYGMSLTSVTIPSTVTSIGNSAFQNCNQLQSITFASGTTTLTVGYYAFNKSGDNIQTFTFTCNRPYKYTQPSSPSIFTQGDYGIFHMNSFLKKVVFGANMTSVQEAEFSYSGVTEVDLSQATSLTSIGDEAFYLCMNLTSIKVPKSLTTIGENAFGWCSLTSFDFGGNLQTIGNNAFFGNNFTSISIPANVMGIGDGAFQKCNHVESITFEAGTTSLTVGTYAFCKGSDATQTHTFTCNRQFTYRKASSPVYGNQGDRGLFYVDKLLTKVTIGGNVTSIPDYSFCTSGVASIEMSGATSLTSIGIAAFYECENLKSVSLPENMETIGNTAFADCSLTTVHLNDKLQKIGYYSFSDNKLTSVIIPSSVTTISDFAFNGNDLTSVIIPENVTRVGNYAFDECDKLEIAYIMGSPSIGTNAFAANTTVANSSITYADWIAAYKNKSSVEEIIIMNDNIANYAYTSSANLNHQFPNLKKVTFAKDVTKLANHIFYAKPSSLNNLETIVFNGSPKDIGLSAFCYNMSLTTISGKVKSVSMYSFGYCEKITSIEITDDSNIDMYAFYDCAKLERVVLPSNLTEIGTYSFRGCTSLKNITIPSKVTTIASAAFRGCSGLTSITIPSKVSTIDIDAFYGCSNLKTATINSNLLTSATYTADANLADVFRYATNITFGSNVQKIGTHAFNGSPTLAAVNLPEGLTEIGERAFAACPLTKLTLPQSVTTYYDNSFVDCGQLKKLTINGNGVAAPEGDKAYCDVDNILWRFGSVEEIVFGKNVTKVGYQACGSENLSQDNIRLKKVTFLGCPEIAVDAFYACYKLATIEGEVKSVASYSFAWTAITSISISDDTCIEKSAFDNCDELVSVTLPSNLEIIKESAFNECTTLTQITLPATLTTIENWAFDQCENLRLVICESAEPADLTNSTNAFRGVPVKEATLKVPYIGLEAYKSAVVWKDFFKYIANDGIYLADGEKYNCTKAYDEVPYIQYTRTFSEKTAGNWQCLYVPFDIDIDDELLEQCDLAEIYTVSFRDEDGDGMITDNDPLAVIISKAQSGMTYRGNTPYLIRAHNAGEVVIENISTSLYKSDSESISCSSMKEQFIFKGIYTTTTINNRYTLNVDGQMSLYTQNTNLKPNRWYLEVKSRNGDESLVNRRFEILVDGEDDMTGIIDLSTSSSDSNDIYSVDGRKVDDIKRPGIYIKNGKKVYVK